MVGIDDSSVKYFIRLFETSSKKLIFKKKIIIFFLLAQILFCAIRKN